MYLQKKGNFDSGADLKSQVLIKVTKGQWQILNVSDHYPPLYQTRVSTSDLCPHELPLRAVCIRPQIPKGCSPDKALLFHTSKHRPRGVRQRSPFTLLSAHTVQTFSIFHTGTARPSYTRHITPPIYSIYIAILHSSLVK